MHRAAKASRLVDPSQMNLDGHSLPEELSAPKVKRHCLGDCSLASTRRNVGSGRATATGAGSVELRTVPPGSRGQGRKPMRESGLHDAALPDSEAAHRHIALSPCCLAASSSTTRRDQRSYGCREHTRDGRAAEQAEKPRAAPCNYPVADSGGRSSRWKAGSCCSALPVSNSRCRSALRGLRATRPPTLPLEGEGK